MPLLIAKPGWVLLQKNEEPLESFDVIAFDAERSYVPEDLPERLKGRRGHFDISGKVSDRLLAEVQEGEPLTVCCEYLGGTLKADVKVTGGPVQLTKAITRFDFVVNEYVGFCLPPTE